MVYSAKNKLNVGSTLSLPIRANHFRIYRYEESLMKSVLIWLNTTERVSILLLVFQILLAAIHGQSMSETRPNKNDCV